MSGHCKAEFYIGEPKQAIGVEIIDDLIKSDINILEPIDQENYLFWSPSDKIYYLQEFCQNKIKKLSPLSRKLKQNLPDKLNGRFCLWFLEKDLQITEDFLNRIQATIIHHSSIRLTQIAEYQVYGVQIRDIPTDAIVDFKNLRFICREKGTPELEDELSVLTTLGKKYNDENLSGIPEILKNLGVNGLRTKTGIIDTGCGGRQSIHENHIDLINQIYAYISYPGSPDFDYVGHGTHTAGIIAGTGRSKEKDQIGYLKGAGFLPRGSLVISDALTAAPFPPETGYSGMAEDIALQGAHICNNSWNDGEGTSLGYTANCAIWDTIVRDATSDKSSLWPMTIVFSAGNQGPLPMTLTSPKEAKNIITVGAVGDIRAGQNTIPWESSSRGPCQDGRIAPLISTSGVNIQSCWPVNDYDDLTGTSSAAAHVTGCASLIREWWYCKTGEYPSPALMKAILVLSTDIFTETLPDPAMGWGILNLSQYHPQFPTLSSYDQQYIFSLENEDWQAAIIPVNPDIPVDIVLCWTDAPAAPDSNPALVNNLDLVVSDLDNSYSGNNFDGILSKPAIELDVLNNLERIRLIPQAKLLQMKVIATNLSGDGVPSNNQLVDQDFAVAIKNGYLIPGGSQIHINDQLFSSPDRINVFVSHKDMSHKQTINVEVFSEKSQKMILLPCNSVMENTGLFTNHFFTGNSGRPYEIPVETSDILTLNYSSEGNILKKQIQIDASPVLINSLDFMDITSTTARIRVECDDMCYAQIAYRSKNSKTWNYTEKTTLDAYHEIELEPLIPVTAYEAYIVLEDRVHNVSDSRNQMKLIEWKTSRNQIIYAAFLNEDPQFFSLEGLWEWGEPQGNGTPGDPVKGKTGTRVIGYNLTGNYENRLEPRHACSPIIDCSSSGNYFLCFHRWLCSESGLFDEAKISAFDSSGDWRVIWQNPYYEFSDSLWAYQKFNITEMASGNSTFQFRFTQGYTDGAFSRCGWNIDDIIVEYEDFPEPTPTPYRLPDDIDIVLEFNQKVYYANDAFILQAEIYSNSSDEVLGLAVSAKLSNGDEYYFPTWSKSPDFIEFVPGKPGLSSIHLVSFVVPQNTFDRKLITFQGHLFKKDFPWIYTSSAPCVIGFH